MFDFPFLKQKKQQHVYYCTDIWKLKGDIRWFGGIEAECDDYTMWIQVGPWSRDGLCLLQPDFVLCVSINTRQIFNHSCSKLIVWDGSNNALGLFGFVLVIDSLDPSSSFLHIDGFCLTVAAACCQTQVGSGCCVLWPSVGSWQWAGHALWQCQGKARRAGVQAYSRLCSGPANGMGLGRPYGTCEKNWGLWRLARGATRQSPVRY